MRGRIFAGVLGALLALSFATPAFAADPTAPVTSIRSVDTAQFPTVKVTLSTPGSTTLSSEDVHVTENGKPVSAVAVSVVILRSCSERQPTLCQIRLGQPSPHERAGFS